MKTKPFKHQAKEYEGHYADRARALLWQQRTGKSKVIVDSACRLFTDFSDLDAVVVFAPNGVHWNWELRQLPVHHWDDVPRMSWVWRTPLANDPGHRAAFKRCLEYREGLPWFFFSSDVCTREDCRRLVKAVALKRKFMLVVDESHDFRTPGSKRSHMLRALARRAAYRRILTGTAVHNSPLHAWSQFELLEEQALGFKNYTDFEAYHAEYETQRTKAGHRYQKLKEYRNLEPLRAKMARLSSVVLREDVEDMPEVIRSIRDVEPTEEQVRLYREFHKAFMARLDSGEEVSIGERTTRFVKLQQIMSGFVVDEHGAERDLAENPRLDALMNEVSLTPGKIIVWCMFQPDIRRVAAALRKVGIPFVEYHGKVSGDRKQKAIDEFQLGKAKVFLGQYASGGSGLDLSAADNIFNYSHTFDAIDSSQSIERATQVGGKHVSAIDFVLPGPDEHVLQAVARKLSQAEYLQGPGLRDLIRGMAI